LSQAGFGVSTATDGKEAVTRFLETRPEVVVLDCRMVGGDGLEAAAEILAMKPSSKIIMLTADGSVLEEAERIGVELFLEKPVSLKRLLDAVLTLCEIKPTSAIISR
jgi:two-component system, chemotaxis family, chemotaxis protein CheY